MRGYWVELPLSLSLVLVDFQFALGNLVGYSCGRWIDPDWDIMGTNNAEGRMVNELPILGYFLYGISSTYGAMFRRLHRKKLTHLPVLSTIIRIVFVGFVPFLVLDGYGVNLIGNGWHKFWLGYWAGLSQADLVHWWLDENFGD
jgi:hypothetical protein